MFFKEQTLSLAMTYLIPHLASHFPVDRHYPPIPAKTLGILSYTSTVYTYIQAAQGKKKKKKRPRKNHNFLSRRMVYYTSRKQKKKTTKNQNLEYIEREIKKTKGVKKC